MKKIFMLACMLTFAFMISAQGGQGGGQMTPEQRAKFQADQLERYKTELKLNDKQFADFKKIEDEYNKKLQDARQGGNFDREAMTKMREERTKKIKAVITADQFKKFEELEAARMQRQGGGGNRQN